MRPLSKSEFGKQRRSATARPRRSNAREEDIQETSPFEKRQWKPGTMLAPVPAVMVSCGGTKEFAPNIITLAWAGTINSEPPMLSISIRPSRHSHAIISRTREFVLNVTTADQVRIVDWCGVKSGREIDKFKAKGLTPLPSRTISCPGIAECPVNLECKVKKIISLGSHDLFLAEITNVQVTEALLDKKGKLRLEKAGLLAYAHGEYWNLGRRLGTYGYSVRKN